MRLDVFVVPFVFHKKIKNNYRLASCFPTFPLLDPIHLYVNRPPPFTDRPKVTSFLLVIFNTHDITFYFSHFSFFTEPFYFFDAFSFRYGLS
jgi:hypothetical protein